MRPLVAALLFGCVNTVSAPPPPEAPAVAFPTGDQRAVDMVWIVDQSGSMRDNQVNLVRSAPAFFDALVRPMADPRDGRQLAALASLHFGVLSDDLGTPGSMVPACADAEVGDDGRLNPIRNGPAIRRHQPWTHSAPGIRPARCENRSDQYPNFLRFQAGEDLAAWSEDVTCNALLGVGGCGLEQQLEGAYRGLVLREATSRRESNQGFLRDHAVLAMLVVSDEEDGSVRDCRYREPSDPDGVCPPDGSGSRLGIFDSTDPSWASADLNLRFYMYRPGSAQDAMWPLGRYIDPGDLSRGFPGLKPGHPERVIFGGILGVPLDLPRVAGSRDLDDPRAVDWARLLGTSPDGVDGLVADSAEGPVSMRQRNADWNCATRVVPACRREGTTHDPAACDTTRQYFAWPARRIAEVARRFAVLNGNAMIDSICRNDYRDALERFARTIRRRLVPAGCLPRAVSSARDCVVRESLPATVSSAVACTAARGRVPGPRDDAGRETCVVTAARTAPDGRPTTAGFFIDPSPERFVGCEARVVFSPGAEPLPGAAATISCAEWVR
ncbi:MAG: hypothetical protein U0325_07315 [Polyangiales bacterium]